MEAPTTQELEASVLKGIEYMNEFGPEGWLDRIDVDCLDISDPEMCIFGQVYGTSGYFSGWGEGADVFYQNTDGIVRDYGFDHDVVNVHRLTPIWVRALTNIKNGLEPFSA